MFSIGEVGSPHATYTAATRTYSLSSTRAAGPAYYSNPHPPKTLDDEDLAALLNPIKHSRHGPGTGPCGSILINMADPVEPIADPRRFDTEAIWTGMGPSAEMEAVGIQSVLSAAGIEAIVNGSAQIPTVPFEVLVTHDKAPRAREVIAEALAAGPEAAEEGERASELT